MIYQFPAAAGYAYYRACLIHPHFADAIVSDEAWIKVISTLLSIEPATRADLLQDLSGFPGFAPQRLSSLLDQHDGRNAELCLWTRDSSGTFTLGAQQQ